MRELIERIKKDGKILPGDILKIDNFLNHQIDVKLMDEIGEEFYHLFKDREVNKILTIESSGIAIAAAASRCFGYVPIVYAKKTVASNMAKDTYECKEHSYTRDIEYTVQVAKEFLQLSLNLTVEVSAFVLLGQELIHPTALARISAGVVFIEFGQFCSLLHGIVETAEFIHEFDLKGIGGEPYTTLSDGIDLGRIHLATF